VDRAEFKDVLGKFITALGAGDEAQLLQLLAPDAVLYGDGGGKALSIVNPLHGPERIARFLLGLYRKYPDQFSHRYVDVNGTPALLVSRGDAGPFVAGYSVADGRITRIFHVLNPDKLTSLPPSR
jgi:RNA polymerase sigma-70 factor, ECF subfamily